MKKSFEPLYDVKLIKQSMTSRPKDINKLINIVAHRSNEQRQQILNYYTDNYNICLKEDLKSELSGNLKKTVVALFYTPVDYDCYQLNKAVRGLTTDEDTLIEILSTRTNTRIKEIKARYPQMFNKELTKVINKETSGFFSSILLKLLEGERSTNSHPNEDECKSLAMRLKDCETNKDIKEEVFIKIFTEKSREEFILITKLYYNLYNKTILETIKDLFSGAVKKVFKTIYYSLLNPNEYFAYRINKAIKAFFTKDKVIIRILVSRDKVDIDKIKNNYKQIFKKDLYSTIKEEIDGDYRNLLLALIGR